MLFIVRSVIVVLFSVLICLFGSIYCLFKPRDPRHVRLFGRLFGRLAWLFGLKVVTRIPTNSTNIGNCVYISNHQNNFDMVTAANAVQDRTVTVGKKSLLWIPLFGQLYWLTGNILIDRNNRAKARSTINQIVEYIRQKQVSVWIFPEGTRSRGRGLMPFKTGAFRAAIAAGVPIVPICISNTEHRIKLSRWNNGHVIVEILPPIETSGYEKDQAGELGEYCRQLMITRLAELNTEVDQLNSQDKKRASVHIDR